MSADERAEREPDIHRILVALDASTHSLAGLEAAVHMAAEHDAELIGLFVEDENLLLVAGVPITREVGSYSAVKRAFELQDIESQLRALRLHAERALAHAAEHARVRWSFRMVRGPVHAEVISAAEGVDLITLGHVGWSSSRRIGSTVRAVLERTRCSVLLNRHGGHLDTPVFVTYDGTAVGRHALSVAARLARSLDGEVHVLVADDRSGAVEQLAIEAGQLLSSGRLDVNYRRFPMSDPRAIAAAAHAGGAGVLVLPVDAEWLSPEELRAIAREARCPVLLARTCRDAPAADAPEQPPRPAAKTPTRRRRPRSVSSLDP